MKERQIFLIVSTSTIVKIARGNINTNNQCFFYYFKANAIWKLNFALKVSKIKKKKYDKDSEVGVTKQVSQLLPGKAIA